MQPRVHAMHSFFTHSPTETNPSVLNVLAFCREMHETSTDKRRHAHQMQTMSIPVLVTAPASGQNVGA
jgi:hypothetical protein